MATKVLKLCKGTRRQVGSTTAILNIVLEAARIQPGIKIAVVCPSLVMTNQIMSALRNFDEYHYYDVSGIMTMAGSELPYKLRGRRFEIIVITDIYHPIDGYSGKIQELICEAAIHAQYIVLESDERYSKEELYGY